MPEEPLMAGALPVPSQDPAHRNAREPRPARHAESRPSARDRHLNPGTNAAEPTIFVTPPSLPQLHSPSDRNGHLSLAESISHHDSGARSVVPATHLAPPFQQQGSHSSGQSKPSNQPLRSTNEDHRGPARGPSSSTNRNINQPPAVPNYSPPNPTPQQNLGSAEPPMRITSVRPPDDPTPTGRRMTDQEADTVCKKLCSRIWNENMGKFYDKVVEADRRGNVDDKLYYQLLDFFYCFLPMVAKAPPSDPIVVRASDLENHRKILNMFGEGRKIIGGTGRNDVHRWFSRPNDGSLKSRMGEGLRGLTAAIKGKKGRGDQVAMK